MTVRYIRLAIAGALLILLQIANAGAPVVQAWGGRNLTFPPPAGYSDYTAESSQLRALALSTTRQENTLLAFFVGDQAWAKYKSGGEMQLDQQYRAEAPKEFERQSLTTSDFAQVRAMLRRRYDDNRSAYQKRLNDEYKSSSLVPNAEKVMKRELSRPDFSLKLGDTQVLGVLSEGDRYLTSASITKGATSSGGRTIEVMVLSLSSSVLLGDRVVYLYRHSAYTNEGELEVAATEFQAWVDDVIRVSTSSFAQGSPEFWQQMRRVSEIAAKKEAELKEQEARKRQAIDDKVAPATKRSTEEVALALKEYPLDGSSVRAFFLNPDVPGPVMIHAEILHTGEVGQCLLQNGSGFVTQSFLDRMCNSIRRMYFGKKNADIPNVLLPLKLIRPSDLPGAAKAGNASAP